jgi:phage-related protein
LQRDPKEWSLTFANADNTERDNILTFLEARKGTESFDWTPPRGSAGKFVCESWGMDTAVAGRTTITATFRQVFEP